MPRLSSKAVVEKATSTPKKRAGSARPGNGGARAGAGRKPKAEKYKTPIAAAEAQIKDLLPELIENLRHLANGGYERVQEKFERMPIMDAGGNIVRYEPVLTERKVERADKDRNANIYLINRIMGLPTQTIEHEFAELSDEELIAAIESEIN